MPKRKKDISIQKKEREGVALPTASTCSKSDDGYSNNISRYTVYEVNSRKKIIKSRKGGKARKRKTHRRMLK
jgi:hypothetical protein